jgi:hypothetical protein
LNGWEWRKCDDSERGEKERKRKNILKSEGNNTQVKEEEEEE